MFKGRYSILRLMCDTRIAQYSLTSLTEDLIRRSNSVCINRNLVLTEKQKLWNSCFQTRNLYTLKNVKRTVICCRGVNSGKLTFIRGKYNKALGPRPVVVQFTSHSGQLVSLYHIALRSDELLNKEDNVVYRPEYDSDSDSDSDAEINDGISRVITVTVGSMRADLIIKKGLGIARNKVEEIFYESRVRVNGKKILKKSIPLKLKDEVDVIKGVSPVNPEFLSVSRLVILSARPKDSDDNEEGITVKLQKYKTLYVENFEDPWTKTS